MYYIKFFVYNELFYYFINGYIKNINSIVNTVNILNANTIDILKISFTQNIIDIIHYIATKDSYKYETFIYKYIIGESFSEKDKTIIINGYTYIYIVIWTLSNSYNLIIYQDINTGCYFIIYSFLSNFKDIVITWYL